MTLSFRSWLPPEALADAKIESAIRKVADQWLADWCAAPGSLVIVDDMVGATKSPEPEHVSIAGGVAIAIDNAAASSLGLAITGLNATEHFSHADCQLLEHLGHDAANDLARRLAGNQQVAKMPVTPETITRTIAAGSPQFSLTVRLKRETIICLLRAEAQLTADGSAIENTSISAALAHQMVDVSALIGACSLPLQAARELGVGDTLLLDTPINADVALAVDQRVAARDIGRLSVQGSSIALTLRRALAAPATSSE